MEATFILDVISGLSYLFLSSIQFSFFAFFSFFGKCFLIFFTSTLFALLFCFPDGFTNREQQVEPNHVKRKSISRWHCFPSSSNAVAMDRCMDLNSLPDIREMVAGLYGTVFQYVNYRGYLAPGSILHLKRGTDVDSYVSCSYTLYGESVSSTSCLKRSTRNLYRVSTTKRNNLFKFSGYKLHKYCVIIIKYQTHKINTFLQENRWCAAMVFCEVP